MLRIGIHNEFVLNTIQECIGSPIVTLLDPKPVTIVMPKKAKTVSFKLNTTVDLYQSNTYICEVKYLELLDKDKNALPSRSPVTLNDLTPLNTSSLEINTTTLFETVFYLRGKTDKNR